MRELDGTEEPGETGLAARPPNAARPPVLARFGVVVLRIPRYVRLAYRLLRDERSTPTQRALAGIGAAYAVSPIDAVPGFIPVLGQLDDLAVLLLSLRQAVRLCPPELAEEHLLATGLSAKAIDDDLATIRATALWLTRQTGKLAIRGAIGLFRMGRRRLPRAIGRRQRASS